MQDWQDDTVFKDLRIRARAAADISVALLKGEPLPKDLMNTSFDNGGNVIPGASLPVRSARTLQALRCRAISFACSTTTTSRKAPRMTDCQ